MCVHGEFRWEVKLDSQRRHRQMMHMQNDYNAAT